MIKITCPEGHIAVSVVNATFTTSKGPRDPEQHSTYEWTKSSGGRMYNLKCTCKVCGKIWQHMTPTLPDSDSAAASSESDGA